MFKHPAIQAMAEATVFKNVLADAIQHPEWFDDAPPPPDDDTAAHKPQFSAVFLNLLICAVRTTFLSLFAISQTLFSCAALSASGPVVIGSKRASRAKFTTATSYRTSRRSVIGKNTPQTPLCLLGMARPVRSRHHTSRAHSKSPLPKPHGKL
jgi:hypothetical protein